MGGHGHAGLCAGCAQLLGRPSVQLSPQGQISQPAAPPFNQCVCGSLPFSHPLPSISTFAALSHLLAGTRAALYHSLKAFGSSQLILVLKPAVLARSLARSLTHSLTLSPASTTSSLGSRHSDLACRRGAFPMPREQHVPPRRVHPNAVELVLRATASPASAQVPPWYLQSGLHLHQSRP